MNCPNCGRVMVSIRSTKIEADVIDSPFTEEVDATPVSLPISKSEETNGLTCENCGYLEEW